MAQEEFQKVGWKPRMLDMVGHLVYSPSIKPSSWSEGSAYRPHSRMIRPAPIKFETRFPNEDTKIKKLNPRPALPSPNTASKKIAAAAVSESMIPAFGTAAK